MATAIMEPNPIQEKSIFSDGRQTMKGNGRSEREGQVYGPRHQIEFHGLFQFGSQLDHGRESYYAVTTQISLAHGVQISCLASRSRSRLKWTDGERPMVFAS